MEQFIHILTAPDNIPIVAMLFIVGFLLGVASKQAMENDRLLDQGKFDEMVQNMRN